MEPALKRTKVSSEGRTVGIASSDVVRLCLQFMQENQMRESAAALQRESSVALNTVTKRKKKQRTKKEEKTIRKCQA